ncbi:hypothetical protein [Priestia megaterium]|uniref:hypothetical protein n=1 Tax=Priestia megaterium TaxID=1404 RepID=UPI0038792582
MTIKITDNSFRSYLKLGDILVAKDGTHYIVAENDLLGFPYKISNLITHQTKQNLQALDRYIAPNGYMLNIGYLEKIIDADSYELNLDIHFKEPSL